MILLNPTAIRNKVREKGFLVQSQGKAQAVQILFFASTT
jgi:hypothetical protein